MSTAKVWAPLGAAMMMAMMLAGCTADPDLASNGSDLAVRHTLQDSQLRLTVESASGLAYEDLLLIINNEPWTMAARMDAGEMHYEVEGKDRPDERIERGDLIRIPVAGQVDVELRHRGSGDTMQQLSLFVDDDTPPAAPGLRLPSRGAESVPRAAVFQWDRASDPSGVTYDLEYWVTSPPVSAGMTRLSGLDQPSYAVPSSEELLPGATYRWHVRAVDGAGNAGSWSEDWEFSTRI